MDPPEIIYVVFATMPWGEVEMKVAKNATHRDDLVKYYDFIPKSGRVWYETYHLKAK